MRVIAWVGPLLPALLLSACGGEPPKRPPTGNDEVSTPVESLDPDTFVEGIDNPFLPLSPGSTWVYRGASTTGGRTTHTVSVLPATREVAGVDATVVSRVVTGRKGKVLEETHDWFAQDKAGNVWHLGEERVEVAGKTLMIEVVWETGVEGAGAGIAMLAEPRVGERRLDVDAARRPARVRELEHGRLAARADVVDAARPAGRRERRAPAADRYRSPPVHLPVSPRRPTRCSARVRCIRAVTRRCSCS